MSTDFYLVCDDCAQENSKHFHKASDRVVVHRYAGPEHRVHFEVDRGLLGFEKVTRLVTYNGDSNTSLLDDILREFPQSIIRYV